jgi:predicted outer membrane repeat protein
MSTRRLSFLRSVPPSQLLAAALLGASAASPAVADVIFVRANQVLPSALQSGASWAFAFKDLQTALAASSPDDEIWIAAGTYRPTAANDRNASFILRNRVHLLGGFARNETLKSQRDVLGNPTVLTGEIGGPSLDDNSLHVLRGGVDIVDITAIDGVTITRGNANGSGSDASGGGGRLAGANVAFYSCTFRDNHAIGNGGAILTVGTLTGRRQQFSNCIVTGNSPTALSFQSIEGPSIDSCTIVGNTKGFNCLNATAGTLFLINSILHDNGSGIESDQFSLSNVPSTVIQSCIIQGWDNANPSGAATFSVDPKFVDADGPDDTYGTPDDNVRLRGNSPAIDSGHASFGLPDFLDLDDDGNNTETYFLDIGGNAREVEDPLVPNTGIGPAPLPDRGAFEFQRPRTILVDADATGLNNGTSWANAYTQLFDAIAELNAPTTGGPGEIWVAQGTYLPTLSNDTNIGFTPGKGARLYGGFIGNGPGGNELDRSERDWLAHSTVLSGNLPGVPSQQNTRGVVRYDSVLLTDSILDGFIVENGRIAGLNEPGGGIRITNDASPTIRNCIIRRCGSISGGIGAGIYVGGGTTGAPRITQCIVVDNGNSFAGAGAGIFVDSETAAIDSCVIAGNRSANSNVGAGVHYDTASNGNIIQNSAIFDNIGGTLQTAGTQITQSGSGVALARSCSIEAFTGSIPGILPTDVLSYSPSQFIDPDGSDNLYGTNDDDFRPTNCGGLVDAGSTLSLPADIDDLDADANTSESLPFDASGRPRRVDLPLANTGSGSGPAIDIGVFEVQSEDLGDADFNGDGLVNAADLAILLGAWLSVDTPQDLTGDCIVDAADLALLLGQWD